MISNHPEQPITPKEAAYAEIAALVESAGEGIVVDFSSNILFGFDKSGLTNVVKTNLNKLVPVLNTYPDTDIGLQGHTDSKGTETYNRKLSVNVPAPFHPIFQVKESKVVVLLSGDLCE
jgi:outer membrane protein OmpA-like peptidoglycan-associated protein